MGYNLSPFTPFTNHVDLQIGSKTWQNKFFEGNWLVVSTHLKNISQIGILPQLGVKKNIFETTT